jgi:apoptosis-inducing factor 3
MKEIAVAKVNEINNNQIQQIAVGDSQILLTKIDNKFYATGAFCTHYGAPLVKGILRGERIVCPWHNACFKAIDGQLEEPPALDSLPTFSTRVEGEDILVSLPDEIPKQRTLAMANYSPNTDSRTFVILGAGAAGTAAVEALRQKGFQGKIVLVSAEAKLPYDRTKLSKSYLQGKAEEDSLSLRGCEFYDQHDIELHFGKAVTEVNAKTETLTFEDDSTLGYDSLLLATGGTARKLDVPGADLANIFTLRQTEDVNSILAATKNTKKALIIGSSFIGMEAAASLAQQGIEVTVVSSSSVPFEKILGEKLGKMFQKLHENQGVKFYFETKVTEFIGQEKVEAAILENGENLVIDIVIVGVGIEPNTNYLKGIQINEKDHSVSVDQYLQTETAGLFAAGDIASFPYPPVNKSIRIEHWRLAAQHGRIAAHNMLSNSDSRIAPLIVPFFWSEQYDLKLRYVGHAEEWDDVIIDGDLDGKKFLAFYAKDNNIIAVAGSGRDQDIAAISELMRLEQMPKATEIKDNAIDWMNQLTINN